MKKAVSLIIAVVLAVTLLPAPTLGAYADRPEAPPIVINNNKLLINGYEAGDGDVLRYESILITRFDTKGFKLANYDCDDISNIEAPFVKLYIAPSNIKYDCIFTDAGAHAGITLYAGDMILIRSKAGSGLKASQWCVLTLTENQLRNTKPLSIADLPDINVTATTLSATPIINDVSYEYAIYPSVTTADFTPQWISLGSVESRGQGTLTASFRPRSTEYKIAVRATGDDLVKTVAGVTISAPMVLYGEECLGPLTSGTNTSITWYVSTNGGSKWTTVVCEPGDEKYFELGKIFGTKEIAIELRRAIPGPVEVFDGTATVTELKAPAVEDAEVIFTEIAKPRKTFPKDLKATGFVSDLFPTNWTLAGGETTNAQLEYYATDSGWTPFLMGVGLPLLTAEQQKAKVKASSYQIRVPADEIAKIPASKSKKFNQQKQVKAPTIKPDYKNEIVKLKAGMKYTFAYYGQEPTAFSDPVDTEISISNAIDEERILYVYTAETGKKSRSAIQRIAFAKRAVSPDNGEGLVAEKNKVKLQKGFEFYGSKEKWGAYTKGDVEGSVRAKSTAKYNAKTGESTGYASSIAVDAKIVYDETGKTVKSVTMRDKKTLSLWSYGISTLTGGRSWGELDESSQYVELSKYSGSCSFYLSPSLSSSDMELLRRIEITTGGELLDPDYGEYFIEELKVGGTVTITLIPKDLDIYRKSVYTVKAIAPLESAPRSVAFGAVGSYGMITVDIGSDISIGTTRLLCIDVYRIKAGETPIYSTQRTLEFDAFAGTTRIIDLRAAFNTAIEDSYYLKVYFKGTAQTTDSRSQSALITLKEADFGAKYVTLSTPSSLIPGSVISVAGVYDNIGIDRTGSSVYQWYKVNKTGSRTAISCKVKSYTVRADDIDSKLGVLVYATGAEYFAWYEEYVVATPAPPVSPSPSDPPSEEPTGSEPPVESNPPSESEPPVEEPSA